MQKTNKVTVLKRNESEQILDVGKIADSIFLAAQDVGGTDHKLAVELAHEAVERLKKQYGRIRRVTSAEIGDMVERVLLEKSHYKTAKAYILNREKKRQVEAAKHALGVHDEVGLSLNALTVAREKYIRKDESGEVVESVGEMFARTAKFLASAEKKDKKLWQEKFEHIMRELRFMPGGRTLANSGTPNNQLANCFVMPMPDDIEGIFESLKESSILKKYGGGVGFTFGHIRPKDDRVSTTSGAACGPVALMQLVNDASDIYLQAGKRRSGNMVTLPVSHPDVIDFIHCKESGSNLPHINYSLAVTHKFMEAAKNNEEWELINPRNGAITARVSARGILEEAARMAWKNGDPGLIFVDEINKYNPTPHVGILETVNLCGEQPLLSYEACNLGSINLAVHVKDDSKSVNPYSSESGMGIDWGKLEETVRVAVRMLDDVVSVCEYPLKKVAEVVRGNRKIGLGVMGWADMLVKLHIPYNSKEALSLAEKLMKFVQKIGWETSSALGKEKGSFPNFKGSLWQKRGYKHFRNATVTTIAPTGTISMMTNASGGIEPHFALAYFRKSMGQYTLPEVNTDLVKAIKHVNGLYSTELMDEIARHGSIKHISSIPKEIRDVFVTAMDLSAEDHVAMLAAFQKYTDNAVSKTINLPSTATVDDVIKVFYQASELHCKGITVYRDGSREGQVLNVGKSENSDNQKTQITRKSEKSDSQIGSECPNCGGKLAIEEGCRKCYGCGFAVCG
ncbi:MAG: adenosylcobalamin-dependent ribonucleoside-diphosphate reductase [bacterium]|nr:adenosylcobalamin-dependent ribonucleoside-diphosphate reductase [bacterium]RIK52083.1 MAG: adenosylcobalamin-dependent ribonucleoside-diphosphate reductase [Candidatus Microgenomates bacterium]